MVDTLPEGWDANLSVDDRSGPPPHWVAYYVSLPDDPKELGDEISALYEAKGRVCVTQEEVDELRQVIRRRQSAFLS